MTENIKTKKFANGFELIVAEKPHFAKKFAGIIVDYGSSDLTSETRAVAGVAHFLEHKLFAKKEGDISEKFEANGANVNAFTSYNETMYYTVFVDDVVSNLTLLFKLISDPFFTTENVNKEREIIEQELKMYQDEPYWRLNQELMTAMYGASPLSLDIAGTETSLANITPESLLNIYKTNYFAANMKLVVAGDVDFTEIASAVTPLVEELVIGEKNPVNVFDDAQPNKTALTITGKTAHGRLIIGLKLPDFKKFGQSNDLVQSLIEIMLEAKLGELSTTYQALQNEELLQQDPYMSVTYTRQGNYAKIMAQTDEVAAVTERMVAALRDDQFSQAIFDLQKKELIAKSFRTIDSIDNMAIELAESRLEDEDYFTNLAELQQIDYDEYVAIVRKVLAKTTIVVAQLAPEK